jgi:XTP/dITP diphosphohydrolase
MAPRMKLLVATTNQGKLRELRAAFDGLVWRASEGGVGVPLELISPSDAGELPVVEEDRPTFAANAMKKAVTIATATGFAVLADDSGLEVDALGGAPGVHSARYAGVGASDADNNRKLLAALATVEDARRSARFRCVLALYDPAGRLAGDAHLEQGVCDGWIAHAPRGANGFGYDPLFLVDPVDPDGGGRTPTPRTMADRTMAARTMAARTMAARTMADRTMADRTMADRTMADRTMADRTMAELTPLEKAQVSHRGRAAAAMRAYLEVGLRG